MESTVLESKPQTTCISPEDAADGQSSENSEASILAKAAKIYFTEFDGQTYETSYEDCYDHPVDPERVMAEQAYRETYRQAAWEAVRWREVDEDAIEAAWTARRQHRQDYRVEIPHGRVVYRLGYRVEAARRRARVQALSVAQESWNELIKERTDPQLIVSVL